MAQLDTLQSGCSIHNPALKDLIPRGSWYGVELRRTSCSRPDLQYYSARRKRYEFNNTCTQGGMVQAEPRPYPFRQIQMFQLHLHPYSNKSSKLVSVDTRISKFNPDSNRINKDIILDEIYNIK